MRRNLCLIAGLLFLFVSCTLQEDASFSPTRYDEYYASFDEPKTKTLADEDGSVVWMKNDQITIFEKYTAGRAFYFTGRNGSASGTFRAVDTQGQYDAGEPIDNYYAVYPHSDDNTLETDGTLVLTFPHEQYYEDDSFGQGANLSVGVSETNRFSFKNVGGFLSFSFYGSDVSVASVTLKGNNGETMAGDMDVNISKGSDPESSFRTGKFATTYKEITLYCDPPVQLGSIRDASKTFWFAVPAISFSKGLTFTVTDVDGNTFTKTSSSARTITRSVLTPFNPIEVVFTVAVAGVSLDHETLSLYPGENSTLSATITPSNATNLGLEWSSSDTSVANVDENGKVTALAAGSATITVTTVEGSKTASCTVTVKPVAVSSVELNKAATNIQIGGSETLTATVLPENAANKNVTWSSSDATVASVDANGKVSALKVGTATITVKTADGNKTATCSVTVSPIGVTGVSLNKTSTTLYIGGTETLTATVTPANATNKSVTWSSSNTAVATVDANGKITAVAAGTATITAKTADGRKTATCTVTVKPVEVTSITLNKTSLTLAKNGTETLTATIAPSNATDKTVTWSSSNTAVATVVNGKVTAVGGGSATITASAGGKSATCAVTVTVAVTGVSLNKTTLSLTKGSTETLTATVAPSDATNKNITWSSNNTGVATVSNNGIVTAVSEGTATITVKTVDGNKTATCAVTVTPILVNSITLNRSTASVEVGSTVSLTATVSPSNAADRTLTWSSSNTAIATVSSNGVVTGVKAGTATITATSNDGSGVKATCQVTVTNVAVTSVALDQTTLSLVNGTTATLTATVSPDNATDKTVTWSSSNTSVATVSNGTVTAKSVGTATITATAGGKSETCNVTVTPILVTKITLSKQSVTINVNSTITLTATATPSNAADKTVSWSSSNTAIARVSDSGVVTGVRQGTTIITATANDGSGVKATCSVTVSVIAVTGITLNKTSLSLVKGSSETLTAAISPSNASIQSLSWSSSNTSIATVDSNGKVTAVNKGSATITARAQDGSGKTATCVVTVTPILVTDITLNNTSVRANIGLPIVMTATVGPDDAENREVKWSSSDPSVATVTTVSGITRVKGLQAGTAIITASAKDASGIVATCTVIVPTVPDEYIDLGLPSGVKWATCNLGASTPEEYGDYYAWGETETKTSFTWTNYSFLNGSDYNGPYTKYVTKSTYGNVDNKTTLELQDDAAHVRLGGNWRMPTKAEVIELIENCDRDVSWTTGIMLFSKINGYSIFLPYAGGAEVNSSTSDGGYWTSSLSSENYNYAAYRFGLTNRLLPDYGNRASGFPIRPVKD